MDPGLRTAANANGVNGSLMHWDNRTDHLIPNPQLTRDESVVLTDQVKEME